MSQRKRKSSPHGNDYNPRKLQRLDTQEWGGIQDIANGDIETLKHLVIRLHGKIAPDNEEIWASSAAARALSEGQQYYDLPTLKATGPVLDLANRPRPPFINKERWLRQIGPGLINALLKYKAADRLESGELNAMLCMILGGHPQFKFETPLGKVLDNNPHGHHNVKFFLFEGNRPVGNIRTLVTWYLVIIDVKEKTLYFVDPSSSSYELSEQQQAIFLHMRHSWKQCKAISLPLAQSEAEVSSGLACIVNAYILARRPRELWNLTKNGSTSFKISRSYTDTLMRLFENSLRLKVHPQWRQSSIIPNKDQPLVRLPKITFDESLVTLALSVKRGNWDNLTKLVQSVLGRLPIATDSFPIPSQTTPFNDISANTAYYIAWTPRACALLSDRNPPDNSDRKLWHNVIGPRIANVLICMAKRRRLSGLELSAYLHMVLVDFIDGHRTPKVMIEKTFGDFLMRSVPRDVEWCNSVMKNTPRFLIFSRGQGIVGHWYVIIVDTNTRQAYCFDSMAAQDRRAEHIEAFSILQEEWAAWMPWTPAPEQMIELPSFSHKDYLHSGFICMYHVLLLFRAPTRLRKLKHGDVVATPKDLGRIIQPAENYIGIKIEGSTKEMTPAYRLESKANAHNHDTAEQNPFGIEVQKSAHKESSAPRKSIKENKSYCTPEPGSSRPGNSKTTPTPVKPHSTKHNHHKAAPAQCKIKAYQRGSTYKDILGIQFDRAPVGSSERLNQYRTGVITTPFIRPGETLEEYSKRPVPNHPSDWQGWDWYDANMAAVDAANREEPPDRKAARVKLQQKRGRGGDLMELDMHTMNPKKQS
ncbi:hypothetical protein FHL15_003939 [Xylaria flabelliformis]|uniref:Uncharacterized protein n=1 Tax=Xylaria flabelliformis TaxID=2512241 RepID=A0A553I4X7_9PEZI|nr:hypothetical protein FHL15_003939 [Xylaria flabelliformis]